MKKCSKCGIVKPKELFSIGRRYLDGRTSWCKECFKKYRESDNGKIQKLKYCIKRHYNLELEEYTKIMIEQNGVCAICGSSGGDSRGGRLHVDHNHNTGKVRGLLCGNCNKAIGYLKDNVELLAKAIVYLEKEKGS